jgi:hypothetical protein
MDYRPATASGPLAAGPMLHLGMVAWRRARRRHRDRDRAGCPVAALPRPHVRRRGMAGHPAAYPDYLDTLRLWRAPAVVRLYCLCQRTVLRPARRGPVRGRRAVRVPHLLSARLCEPIRRRLSMQVNSKAPIIAISGRRRKSETGSAATRTCSRTSRRSRRACTVAPTSGCAPVASPQKGNRTRCSSDS